MDKEYLAKKKDLMSGLAINQTSIGFQCKNLLKPINSKTRMGVTYTVNEDGSVTLSGTSTNENYFSIPVTLQPGKYKVSGMPETSQTNTYRVDLTKYDVGIGVYKSGTKEFEVEFTETTTVYYSIKIDSSYKEPLDGVTFYPMIRYADIIDDTYEPYSDSVDTRIIKNKSDVAVNKSTLGYQRKNELNETEFLSSITSASGGTLSKSENSITLTATESSCTTEPYNEHDGGYRIPVSPNTTYILSWESNDNHYGFVSVFMNGSLSNYQHANNDTIKHLKFTTDIDTTFITIELSVAGKGDSLTYSNIMLRYADITDDTYEPYKESVDERISQNTSDIDVNKSDIGVNKSTLGYQCKNLLKNTAVTTTKSGITFTVNDDKSITVSGTATSRIIFLVGTAYISQTGNYTYTGTPSGGASSTYSMNYRNSNVYKDVDTGNGTTAQFEGGKTYEAVIDIRSGVTISNLTFSPMLRDADIIDDTYEPYKENVDERLIENKSDIAVNKSAIAVNKSALGYQRKNLLPYPKSIVKGGITFTCDENGYMTGSNTTSDSRQWTSANAQYSMYLKAGTYYFSSFAETVCTNSDGRAYIIANGTQIVGVSTRETHVEKMFTLTESTTIYVVAKVYDGKVAFMIREADITDETYEPYKDSIDERLIKIQNEIGDIGSILSSIVEVS